MVTPRRYAAGRSRGGVSGKLAPSPIPIPIKLIADRFAEPVRSALAALPCPGCWSVGPATQVMGIFIADQAKTSAGESRAARRVCSKLAHVH